MEDTRLEELLEDEHQKLMYIFDYMMERAFYMELSEIITGKTLKQAVCSLAVGEPPVQMLSPEEMEKSLEKNFDPGEDFYGDSEYNEDELDPESLRDFDEGSVTDGGFDNRF